MKAEKLHPHHIELTETEGAIIEALRKARRVQSDPEARAEEEAWEDLRFLLSAAPAWEIPAAAARHVGPGEKGARLAVAAFAVRDYIALVVKEGYNE